VSRNGRTFKSWPTLCDAVAKSMRATSAVLDGEVVCLDDEGRPDFRALLFRRADPHFYTFDVLSLDGIDLRDRPLIERKRALRRIVPRRLGRLRYLGHVAGRGCDLFRLACEQDLEGVVAKPRSSVYRVSGDNTPWVKIKNAAYTQARDRHELFERRATNGRRR